jgi:hypothetical protein
MVKKWGSALLPRLEKMGFEIEEPGDIALLPDAAFERSMPTGKVRDVLLAEYRERKAQARLSVENLMSGPPGS